MDILRKILGVAALFLGYKMLFSRPEPATDYGQIEGTIAGQPMKMKEVWAPSISNRIGEIKKLILKGKKDATIRKTIADVVRNIPERDYDREISTVFFFVKNNIRFTKDVEDMDTYQHPVRTLELGMGDCDDFVILLGSLLSSIGHKIRIKVVQTEGEEDFNHVYLLVGLPSDRPSKWIPLDASHFSKPGAEVSPDIVLKQRTFEV